MYFTKNLTVADIKIIPARTFIILFLSVAEILSILVPHLLSITSKEEFLLHLSLRNIMLIKRVLVFGYQ